MTTTKGESKGNYEGINVRSYGMKEGYLTDANMGVCTKIDHSCCPCQLLVQHVLYSIQCPCGPTATSATFTSFNIAQTSILITSSWTSSKSPPIPLCLMVSCGNTEPLSLTKVYLRTTDSLIQNILPSLLVCQNSVPFFIVGRAIHIQSLLYESVGTVQITVCY